MSDMTWVSDLEVGAEVARLVSEGGWRREVFHQLGRVERVTPARLVVTWPGDVVVTYHRRGDRAGQTVLTPRTSLIRVDDGLRELVARQRRDRELRRWVADVARQVDEQSSSFADYDALAAAREAFERAKVGARSTPRPSSGGTARS